MSMFEGVDSRRKDRFVRTVTMFLFALTVLAIVFIINGIKEYSYIGSGTPVVNTVTVSSDAEESVSPDLATFTVGVTAEAVSATEAQRMMSEKMNPIIAHLRKQGIAEEDIQTSNFSVYPRYEYPPIRCITNPCPGGERQLAGFEASQSVTVKVRALEKAGTLLSGVSELGATNVSGLSFTVEERDEIERRVRQEAIKKAQKQARELASDLGASLGRIVSFSEGDGGMFRAYALEQLDSAGKGGAIIPDVPVGENTIRSSVTITYEIK